MAKNFHFISGLPRSGSTLLSAILRQNPSIHAGMSSPIASLYEGIISQVSAGSEMASMVNTEQRAALLRGLFDSYYGDFKEDLIIDTNRAWTAKMPSLLSLFPEAKIICTVRDVSWVLDSLERQYRSNKFENTRLFNSAAERATVYTRTEALSHANRLVGFAWQALREACWGEYADRLVMVDYDILTTRPADVIRLLYDFLGEEQFEHDFDNVVYDAPDFDTQLGVKGLHKVKPKVAPQKRETVLPPDVFKKYSGMAFWRDLKNCKAFRIVAQPQQQASPEGPVGGAAPVPVAENA